MVSYRKWEMEPEERMAQGLKLFPMLEREKLPAALQCRRLREDVMKDIEEEPEVLKVFRKMKPEHQEALVQFCMGNRGLNVLYDPFFKKLFLEGEAGLKRLERLLSLIMGQKITIVRDEHLEVTRRSEDASVMIMDLVVKLEDGSYVNLEVQRRTHDFPFKRAECYSADILVHQYDELKREQREAEPDKIVRFDYNNMRPVYVIVLMNSASRKFNTYPDHYIHKSNGKVKFDTGLEEDSLQKYIMVSLDIFRKMEHNELTELEAWMYFLASDRPEDVRRVIEAYPEFEMLYREIIRFQYNPKELMAMVPEAIRMMDEGSFQLMIDRLQEQLDTKVGQLADLTKQNEELAGQNEELAGQNKELAGQQEKLAEQNKALLTRQEELLTENSRQLIEVVENVMKGFQVDCQSACKVLGRTVEEYETAKGHLTGKS